MKRAQKVVKASARWMSALPRAGNVRKAAGKWQPDVAVAIAATIVKMEPYCVPFFIGKNKSRNSPMPDDTRMVARCVIKSLSRPLELMRVMSRFFPLWLNVAHLVMLAR